MSLLSRLGFASAPVPTQYEAALEQAERLERARLDEIRRKAEANEASARHNSTRARCLGLDRAGHAL